MKIVFQHNHPLPILCYGGIERILYWHMVELIKQGHQVVLIGHRDSLVQDRGIQLIAYDSKIDPPFQNLIPSDADILHLTGNDIFPGIKIPVLHTIHGNGKLLEKFPLNTLFVSRKHAEIHGSDQFIHNALDLSEYPFDKNKKLHWNQFLFLAKASWKVKNLKQSILACKKTKKHLHIAGGKSYLPSQYIHSHGMVGGNKKLQILNQCDALLFPVRWHEPFGIAILEAMALGLPVIGSPYGSLPELINPDVGVICQNYNELINVLMSDQYHFSPQEIRHYVETRFSIANYTKKYLETYTKILDGESLHSTPPELKGPLSPQSLLPF